MIPTGRIDQNAVNLLGVYPAPTTSGVLANNFTWVPKQSQNNNTWDIRIDHNINANNILFGVFDRSLFTRIVPSNLPGLAVAGSRRLRAASIARDATTARTDAVGVAGRDLDAAHLPYTGVLRSRWTPPDSLFPSDRRPRRARPSAAS